MLKRIPVSSLTKGMYIHEICGSWMEHPFWRSSFLLTEESEVEKLIDSDVTEVLIDTAKGLDLVNTSPPAAESSPPTINDDTAVAIASPNRTTLHEKPVSLAHEAARASRICASARPAVNKMFAEARMGQAIEVNQVVPIVEEINASVARNQAALISVARLKTKDDYTYLHSVAVCALMTALAQQMNLPESDVHAAGLAGLFHDLGKATIADDILNKPGKLTDEEFAIIKRHPVEGHKILSRTPEVGEAALDVCLHHHEKIDGTGYPDQLSGENISLFSRMAAVCDVYDAITSNRPYKHGWNPAEAVRKMAEWSKTHFDSVIFQAFVRCIGIYPVGSLVRLQSGKLGIVIKQNEQSLLNPTVRVFFSTRSNAHIPPKIIDLARHGQKDSIAANENPNKWGFRNLEKYWQDVIV